MEKKLSSFISTLPKHNILQGLALPRVVVEMEVLLVKKNELKVKN